MLVASYYGLRRVVRRAIGRGFVLEIHRAPKGSRGLVVASVPLAAQELRECLRPIWAQRAQRLLNYVVRRWRLPVFVAGTF